MHEGCELYFGGEPRTCPPFKSIQRTGSEIRCPFDALKNVLLDEMHQCFLEAVTRTPCPVIRPISLFRQFPKIL